MYTYVLYEIYYCIYNYYIIYLSNQSLKDGCIATSTFGPKNMALLLHFPKATMGYRQSTAQPWWAHESVAPGFGSGTLKTHSLARLEPGDETGITLWIQHYIVRKYDWGMMTGGVICPFKKEALLPGSKGPILKVGARSLRPTWGYLAIGRPGSGSGNFGTPGLATHKNSSVFESRDPWFNVLGITYYLQLPSDPSGCFKFDPFFDRYQFDRFGPAPTS